MIRTKLTAYTSRLSGILSRIGDQADPIEKLAMSIHTAWQNKGKLFICGNGGSAANAIHLANDFNYGIDRKSGIGMRVEALTANAAVVTCIGNDVGYDAIFSQQLRVKADAGDVLLAFSGSGNSQNILSAVEVGNELGMKTFAILGFSGGQCLQKVQVPIHFPVDDMQIAEDLQMIVGHTVMQWLSELKKK